MLRQGDALLRSTLATYTGKQQREVLVLWDVQKTIQEIAAGEEVATLRTQIIGRPEEETTTERIALGQMIHAGLQQRRSAISTQMISRLRSVAEDLIVHPNMDDSMVINLAMLIADSREGDLDDALDALDAQFDGQLQIRCVGPLPAYSFATLEVRALPFEAINTARQQLGLPEEVRSNEIKRAYRKLAAQVHPDLHPDAADADSDMETLSAAYQVLSILAKAQAPADAAEQHDWPCQFDRATVEATMLLNVVRQEFAA
jgi:hypothetical protein